ncbi:MAG: uncharacterized protein V7606_4850 [Burkholderiales bacterium]
MQSLSLSLNEKSGELRAQFDPANGMPAPDATLFRQALGDQGWSDFHLDEKAIEVFINNCRKTGQPLESVVGIRRNGEFSITLDDDLMSAWLTLSPAQGGQPVTSARLDEALRTEGVIHGILREEIEAALAAGHCEHIAIARGEPAKEGEPTRFESLFDKEKEASGKEDLERIRYADLCHILVVKTGDHLMRRLPPVAGTKGFNIKGHPLLARPTPDIPFRTDLKGAARDKEDPDLLIAIAGGQPVSLGNGVMVNSVIDVADVDLGTGSIEFEGTLRVGGDVKAGMRIKVTGDVVVNGTVEAAEITAGGNVAVRGGIVGHPDPRPGSHGLPETTARIFCEGSVQALFIESAHIEAGKSIIVDRSARQCELMAREEIVVGKAKTGHITGGRTQATLRIATGSLGSSTGTKTFLQVGLDPYLEKQIGEKELELKRKVDEVDRVIKLLAYFRQNPQKGAGGLAEKVEGTRRMVVAAIDDLSEELKVLREKMELSVHGCVEARGEIYYGVEVRIANQIWHAPDDIGAARIQMEGGRIAVDRSGR